MFVALDGSQFALHHIEHRLSHHFFRLVSYSLLKLRDLLGGTKSVFLVERVASQVRHRCEAISADPISRSGRTSNSVHI